MTNDNLVTVLTLSVGVLTAIVAVVTLAVGVLTGFLVYILVGLSKRIDEAVEKAYNAKLVGIESRYFAKVTVFDLLIKEVISVHSGETGKPEDRREALYTLQQVGRLGSRNEGEVRAAISALHAMKVKKPDVVVAMERIRQCSSWSAETSDLYEKLIGSLRS